MSVANLWYVLAAVLFIAYAALDGFDLGVGALSVFFKAPEEKSTVIRAIGPVWNGNEVWLLAAVGSLLAAFPPVYAALLSGLYVPAILFLFSLIGRDVAIEFRHRVQSRWARGLCEIVFGLASAAAAFLIGFAAGNAINGLPLDATHSVAGTGFAAFGPYPVVTGLLGLSCFMLQGASWLLLRTEGAVQEKNRALFPAVAVSFVCLAVLSFVLSLIRAYGLMPWESGRAAVWISSILAVLSIGACAYGFAAGRKLVAFLGAEGIVASTVAWIASARFPVLVPSTVDPAYSLTVANASAGSASLSTILILAAIGVPIAIAINVLLYSIFRARASGEDVEGY